MTHQEICMAIAIARDAIEDGKFTVDESRMEALADKCEVAPEYNKHGVLNVAAALHNFGLELSKKR